MLNIGLIGKTEILEPHVKRIQKIKGVNIVGKTSVGTDAHLNSFHFSIPEINRIELIERADIIIMDNSSILPFKMLCDIVKKSKHIFTIEYLKLTIDECSQLVSLANESGSVIQVTNPRYFTPATQWLNNHLITPTLLDISYVTEETITDSTLISLLLMLIGTTGTSPKKIGAVTFRTKETESKFNNVRLEFGDASVVNINYGNLPPLNEFKIKSYSPGQFVTLNFSTKVFQCNNKPINLSEYPPVNEIDRFLHVVQKKSKQISNIEDYLIVLYAVQKINKKIMQFSTH
ncbi:hypothetical protein GM418_16080 [Maribellus comscasis]|uniref:Gfo/Idh/MocA-like oxidoreductase N-terminal domain-containing protein n=1 Tax=Maribellus comscasis TaxID=2681766 RepID=A0A6I6JY80_9BACT|nr:hypothetical protein [Maribellus comscasis]QGY45132.1 hypothetical protein GM418_16080 [Maribellus comscasis]